MVGSILSGSPIELAIDGPHGALKVLEGQGGVVDGADAWGGEINGGGADRVKGGAVGLIGLDGDDAGLFHEDAGALEEVSVLAGGALAEDDIDVIAGGAGAKDGAPAGVGLAPGGAADFAPPAAVGGAADGVSA